MTTPNVRILFLHEDDNAVQETLSLLRNAGINAHGDRVEDGEALQQALANDGWTLIIFSLGIEALDRADTLRLIRQLDRDVPVILLDREKALYRITEGMQAGATDVILGDEDDEERLLLVVQRELRQVAQRAGSGALETALAEAERRCKLLLETSRAAIAYVHDGMHVYVNGNYLELFGYDDADDLAGIPFLDLVTEDHKDGIRELFRNPGETGEAPFSGTSARGSHVQGEIVLTQAMYEGEPCMQVLIRPPVSGHATATQIQEVQTHDPLTGLSNRQNFLSELERQCAQLEGASQTGALLFITLDKLPEVRSTIGLRETDRIIAEVAGMLRRKLGDDAGLARFTDDAFALTLTDVAPSNAEDTANDIRRAVEDFLVDVDGRTLRVTANVAIAPIAAPNYSPHTALARAHETATQISTEAGKANTVQLFSASDRPPPEATDGEVSARDDSKSLLELVRQALSNNAFQLYYQPIISLRGDDEELYEVFVRLPAESGKLIRPMDFLPAAEKVGLGGKVDRWIVLQSIKTLSNHRTKGHNTRLIINLTHNSLADKSFLPWLTVAIKAARLPSDAVIFQISEGDANTYLKQAREFTKGLAELHCRGALSHFGSTQNPFGVLRHLNIDLVKLDGSLVEHLEKDAKYKETLSATIGQLQSLGKLTIVPMVETAPLLASLWQAGANYIQGHYLQEPSTEMNYDFGAED